MGQREVWQELVQKKGELVTIKQLAETLGVSEIAVSKSLAGLLRFHDTEYVLKHSRDGYNETHHYWLERRPFWQRKWLKKDVYVVLSLLAGCMLLIGGASALWGWNSDQVALSAVVAIVMFVAGLVVWYRQRFVEVLNDENK